MENLEDLVRDLREKNSGLALEVQSWKVTATQKEKEKLEIMKEVNELRLKLSILRSSSTAQARKLDTALQTASEEALSHMVQASGAIARSIELTKQYMQDRHELESSSPRWSNPGGATGSEKVNRVPPLLLGGQSIQPVVSLSRTMLSNRSLTRSPNLNPGVTRRAVPMHMLQDVYIPLTRIDAADLVNAATEDDGDRNNSIEDLGLEDSNEQVLDESLNRASNGDIDDAPRLEAVMEDCEEPQDFPEEEHEPIPPRLPIDNPLEGPSWMLDIGNAAQSRESEQMAHEPDSTTPCVLRVSLASHRNYESEENAPVSLAFTPTVRKRKRIPSPPLRPSCSPRPLRKDSNTNRVLKVVVAKMRLSDDDPWGSGDLISRTPTPQSPRSESLQGVPSRRRDGANQRDGSGDLTNRALTPQSPRSEEGPKESPLKRRRDGTSHKEVSGDLTNRALTPQSPRSEDPQGSPPRRKRDGASQKERSPRFDAPSPNGATDARVIVSEARDKSRDQSRDRSRQSLSVASLRASRRDSASSRDNSDGEERCRRARKHVSYKEKPLNRKLRR